MRNLTMLLGVLVAAFALSACGAGTNETSSGPQEAAPTTRGDDDKPSETQKTSEQEAKGDMYLLKVKGMT